MIVPELALLALTGCGWWTDPELLRQRAALDAWDRGAAALDAKDPKTAVAAFDEALARDHDDALLLAWKAQATADGGDLDGAIALLQQALVVDPDLAEARYNLAAYEARKGDADASARDLREAFAAGVSRLPRDVLEDPDFAEVVHDPAFADLVPDATLSVAAEGPEGDVFWGSEFTLRLRIAGAGDEMIAITPMQDHAGPIEVVGVVEDQSVSTQGPFRDVTWTFRVDGAGPVSLGPLVVQAGTRSARVDAITLQAMAPPGKATPASLPPLAYTTPREAARLLTAPAARRTGGSVVAVIAPGDRVEVVPPPSGAPVRYELRERGEPVWQALEWRDVPAGAAVRVERGGERVLDVRP